MRKEFKNNCILAENEYVKVEFEDTIVICTFKAINIDLEIAQKVVESRIAATNGGVYSLISDIKCVTGSTKAARDFFASEAGCEGIIATALIIDSPLGTLIGNFYININKPLRPVKLFTDYKKAKSWLLENFDPTLNKNRKTQ